MKSRWIALTALAVLLLPAFAFAALPENNLINTVIDDYKSATASWAGAIGAAALWLFWALATIEIVWTGVTLFLRNADFGEVLAEITFRVIYIGFFLMLFQLGPSWAQAIIKSLAELAGNASVAAGGSASVSPSGIFDLGIKMASKIWDSISFWDSAIDSLAVVFGGLIVVIAFALMTAMLAMALIEAYIVLGAGIVLLGFGALRYTKDFALKYLIYAFSVGLKIFVLLLIVGLGEAMMNGWLVAYEAGDTQLLLIVAGSILMLGVVKEIPSILQGLINGLSFSTGDSMVRSAGQIGQASVAGGALAASGAIGLAGAGSAIANAARLAQSQGATGIGGTIAGAAGNLASAAKAEAGEVARRGRMAGPGAGTGHRMAEAMKTARKELASNAIKSGG